MAANTSRAGWPSSSTETRNRTGTRTDPVVPYPNVSWAALGISSGQEVRWAGGARTLRVSSFRVTFQGTFTAVSSADGAGTLRTPRTARSTTVSSGWEVGSSRICATRPVQRAWAPTAKT